MMILPQSAAWSREAGEASPPPGVDLLLTDACNLRCGYCPIWGDDALHPAPSMMDVPAAFRLLDEISAFRPMIRLFGGEPFLHPRWHDVVLHARSLGLHVTAVSNGTRLLDDAERIVSSGMLAVGLSLDNAATENDARRGDGVFGKVREGIRRINAIKARTGSRTPLIEIYTTVHENSYRDLCAWATELSTWGVDTLRLQHLIWFSPEQLLESMKMLHGVMPDARFFRREEVSYCRETLPAINPEVLVAQLKRLEELDFGFPVQHYPNLPLAEMISYYGDVFFSRRRHRQCSTMENYSFIDPSGKMYPCVTLDVGNVFERGFMEVWNGDRFRTFRRLIRENQRLPICQRCPDGSGQAEFQ